MSYSEHLWWNIAESVGHFFFRALGIKLQGSMKKTKMMETLMLLKETMIRPSQPDWLSLPQDLLEKISHGVSVSCGDYVRFRAVCKYWRCATPKIPPQCHLDPWIMLPSSNPEDRNKYNGDFYSFVDDKVHQIDLPREVVHEKMCIGSSQGWLCFASLEEDGITASVSILNPLTKDHIKLPPITNIPRVFMNILHYNYERLMKVIFNKFILSDRATTNYYMVTVGEFSSNWVAFCGAGDSKWSIASNGTCDFPERYDIYKDVIYHHRQLIRVCNSLMITSLDRIKPWNSMMEEKLAYGWKNDLVDVGGELVLVLTLMLYPKFPLSFHVYKIRLGGVSEEWATKMTSLGDCSVFVDRKFSFSLSVKDAWDVWFKPNCIYFSGRRYDMADAEGNIQGYDVGVFNLGDGSIEPLVRYADKSESFGSAPIPLWIRPSLC